MSAAAGGSGRPSRPARRLLRTASIRFGIGAVKLGFLLGRLRPVRDEVLLATLRATAPGGNLLYLQRELARRTPPVPVRVLAARTRGGIGGRIASALVAFRAGFRLAATRVVIVDDWFFPMYVIKPRPGTIRIQTWHAAGAFKKIGYSVLDKTFGADELMAGLVRMHSNYTLCVMPSPSATRHYMDAFRLPAERFTSALGVPRTDLFFDAEHRAQATSAIRARYRLPEGHRFVLYAPTFRGDHVTSARYDDNLDLRAACEILGPEWVVLMRLHPFVRRGLDLSAAPPGAAIDVSDWPDMNELMFVADILVTDYSSAIFEFALLERPMAFLAPDYEAYEQERGFYFDYRSGVPGPVFEQTSDLARWIAAGDFDLDRVRRFAHDSFEIADGHASERLVDQVILPALRADPVRPHR